MTKKSKDHASNCRKICYPDPVAAMASMQKLRRKHPHLNSIYFCDVHGAFHLTKNHNRAVKDFGILGSFEYDHAS